MSALIPFLALDQNWEQVQEWVNQQLASVHLRAVQTFDLRVARLAHPDCHCPHHGTANCNCQMIVLLVYQKKEEPVTLVIHGQDGRTWLSFANPLGQRPSQQLEIAIRRALVPGLSNASSLVEVPYETHATV
ncbi:MAG: hypothetical protein HYX49_07260 [Chloroflexi bacterium]|nr:hypothetical protein [Chloroflexota bacterium]